MSTIKSSAENLTLNADGANNDIKFQSNGSEVASIDQAGLISAGGATLTGNVTATGSGRFNTTSYTPVTNGEKVSIEGTSAWQQGLSFSMWGAGSYNSSFASGAIGVPNNPHTIYISGGAQVVGNTGAGNWAKTLSATSASFNTIGGGGSSWFTDTGLSSNTAYTPTKRLSIDSDGLKFNGDTAAANALDDYEEGSFTPSVYGTGTAGSPTYTSQFGKYTKIGNVVSCYIRITTSALGGIAGDVRLGNLPFTSKATSDVFSSAACGYAAGLAITSGTSLSGWVADSSTYIKVTNWDVAAGTSYLQGSEWTDDGTLMISVVYHT